MHKKIRARGRLWGRDALTAFGRAMGELPKEQEEGGEILKGFFEKKKKKK